MDTYDSLVLRRYAAEVKSRIETRTQAVLSGNFQTLETYREAIGHLRGLNEALAALDDAVRDNQEKS